MLVKIYRTLKFSAFQELKKSLHNFISTALNIELVLQSTNQNHPLKCSFEIVLKDFEFSFMILERATFKDKSSIEGTVSQRQSRVH